ncbi:hypothetical protein OEZ85_012889 [Tetradesmus obliquus]|uniref:Uncharacterized protein n=1 Tax=Tetradesmus obliquus TaxID=3088 RepID=A0ABY8U4P3_TETOB|nr:hypothetical protein OEZ85_012889 [Tetradesmus obliquus]
MEPICSLSTLKSDATWASTTTWTDSTVEPGSLLWRPEYLLGENSQQSHQQQADWQPSSAIRADITPARFRMPQAGLIKNANGVVAIGLGEKPGRRINGPGFEAQKAAEALQRLQLQEQPLPQQQPQRFAAAAEHKELLQQRQAREEQQEEQRKLDHLTAMLHASPEHMTSADNFLSDGLSLPRSCPPSRATAAHPTPRTAASTVPNSARSCSSYNPSSSRPGSRPASPEVGANARARMALRGQLMCGSLLVEEEEEDEEQQQQREARQEMAAAAAAAYDEAARKEEELIAMYPHGAPRRVIREYRAQGVELPVLGYASALLPSPRRP